MSDTEYEVADEYVDAQLRDRRRARRLMLMAEKAAMNPSASFPDIFDEAELEGAYRFFSNSGVRYADVIAPHIQRTVERCAREDVVLALHDTSMMTYNSEGRRVGLGETRRGKQDFLAHVTLAVSSDGSRRPLGVLGLSTHRMHRREGRGDSDRRKEKSDFRSDYDRWDEQLRDVQELPLQRGKVIHVADREADDYELLVHMSEFDGRFVIRNTHNRRLAKNEDSELQKLDDAIAGIETERSIERDAVLSRRTGVRRGPSHLSRHPAREVRKSTLRMGACRVSLRRPRSPKSRELPSTLELNVVVVREVDAPEGEAPVRWVLFTRESIETDEDIERVVDIYRARWVIEEYFKALKTGCSYEKRQLGSLHALSNALALFAPIAWRLLLMRTVAREETDVRASEVFGEDEILVIRGRAKKKKRRIISENPTVREVLMAVAAIGGHLRRNGEPGWQVLERGYAEVMLLLEGYQLAKFAHQV